MAVTKLPISHRNDPDRGEQAAAAIDRMSGDAARAESEAESLYREYVRGLDEVPVLREVVREPPRRVIRDFRLGERPDARKAGRQDPYTLLEKQARDLQKRYAEYTRTLATPKRAASGRGKKPASRKKAAKRTKGAKRG